MEILLEYEVKETPDPHETDDGYEKTNKIFTFPKDWDFEKCRKWCYDRNYNIFVFGMTLEGANEFTCAYSWKLSHFNQFGEWSS